MSQSPILLEVDNLGVEYELPTGKFSVVDAVSLQIHKGESVGIVGESGCGKSVTALAIMGLIGPPGNIYAGEVRLRGEDLLRLTRKQRRMYLGRELSMVFQEPVSSLNPCFTIGDQLVEVLSLHTRLDRNQRRQRAIELLKVVGISDADKCFKAWPHQLSGGMNQRVMIAMAISCNPSLLIADEPTTALDVTIQAKILALLSRLQQKNNMAMLLITHDLLLLPGVVQRVVVMYAGQVVEVCKVEELFDYPLHPYTEALLKSLPVNFTGGADLMLSIEGTPPKAGEIVTGCRFHPRCEHARDECRQRVPELEIVEQAGQRKVRCLFPLNSTEADRQKGA